jgi:hypothetical protein
MSIPWRRCRNDDALSDDGLSDDDTCDGLSDDALTDDGTCDDDALSVDGTCDGSDALTKVFLVLVTIFALEATDLLLSNFLNLFFIFINTPFECCSSIIARELFCERLRTWHETELKDLLH